MALFTSLAPYRASHNSVQHLFYEKVIEVILCSCLSVVSANTTLAHILIFRCLILNNEHTWDIAVA